MDCIGAPSATAAHRTNHKAPRSAAQSTSLFVTCEDRLMGEMHYCFGRRMTQAEGRLAVSRPVRAAGEVAVRVQLDWQQRCKRWTAGPGTSGEPSIAVPGVFGDISPVSERSAEGAGKGCQLQRAASTDPTVGPVVRHRQSWFRRSPAMQHCRRRSLPEMAPSGLTTTDGITRPTQRRIATESRKRNQTLTMA